MGELYKVIPPGVPSMITIIRPPWISDYCYYDVMIIDGLSTELILKVKDDKAISAVIGLVFDASGKLLLIKNKRGWDFPGGHIEPNEKPEEALRREVMEEASVTIKDLHPFLSAGNDRVMIFYSALLEKSYPFQNKYETSERKFIDVSSFEEMYTGGMPELANYALSTSGTSQINLLK